MTALQKVLHKNDRSFPLQRYILLLANNFIRLAVQLAVIFLYSRSLPIDAYGNYQTVWLYVNVISVITLFGLPNLILTYSLADILGWLKKSNRALMSYGAILVALLFFFFMQPVQFNWLTKAAILLLILFQNVAIVMEYLTIKQGSDNKVLLVNVIAAILFLFSHIIALEESYSLSTLLFWLVVIQILKFVLLVTFKKEDVRPHLRTDIGRQWLYLGLIDSLTVVYRWFDKWLILFFISVSQFAIYFNGSYEIPVFILMVSAVRNVMLVEMSKENDLHTKYVKPLLTNTTLLLAAIVFPAFSFFLFYNKEFFLLFFGEQYAEAIPIFLISIFLIPLRITSFTALLQAKHRNDLVLKGLILDLSFAVIFMLMLYPLLGIPGIALAFVLSSYLQVIYYLRKTIVVTQLKLSDFFPLKSILMLLSVSLLVTALLHFMINNYLPQYTLIAGIISSILLAVILLQIRRSKMLRLA